MPRNAPKTRSHTTSRKRKHVVANKTRRSSVHKRAKKLTLSARIQKNWHLLLKKTEKVLGPKRTAMLPALCIALGLFLLGVSGLHSVWRDRALSLDKQVVANYKATEQTKHKPKPVKIAIQWFLNDVAVEEEVYHEGQWTVSETQASHLADSASPGEPGNDIIYGHNTREIMGNIRALKGGEQIHVTTEDGVDHIYKIVSMQEVDPSQTTALEPTTDETLTLYTCSGFLDKKRYVVQAKPI